MSVAVTTLLARARGAKPEVSPLDAVMGEDWAIVEAGRPRRIRAERTKLALGAAFREEVARFKGSGLPARKPQTVVKLIRKGGTSSAGGMRAQMDYLSRDNAQPLQRSEAEMGVEIDAEESDAMERAWRMPAEGSGKSDRTSHFLTSFPEGTGHRAAEQAGRAWAEEMFGSGNYAGDSYDYYTAFHTDRAHPHMHVVVYRRGLENGEWLKVSRRSDLNYDRMREVLVEVAAREGIELEATPRLERGVHDRPVPDAEYRRAREEGRAPVAPAHTQETAIIAAATLLHQGRHFATRAQLVESRSPEIATVLRAASAAAMEGRALAEITSKLDNRQVADMNERGEAAKIEIRQNIEKMDRGIEEVRDNARRMRLAREIAELKRETAPMLGEERRLAAFAARSETGLYRGLPMAMSERGAVRQSEANDKVRAVAERYGVDPEATIERYAGAVPSQGLEAQFRRAEGVERAQSRAGRNEAPETDEARRAALSRMHREIGDIYAAARTRDREREAPRADASRDAPGSAPNATAQGARQAREAAAQEPAARAMSSGDRAAKRAEAEREEARRVQERANTERSRRERDDGRGR